MLQLRGYRVSIDSQALRDKTLGEFEAALNDIEDPLQYTLQAHLYLEQLLGRIIVAIFPRGTELLDGANWSFIHKLLLVHAIDVLPHGTFEALKSFNSLRNRLSHRLRYELTLEDIAAIAATHPEAKFVKKAAAAYPLKALQQLAIALLGAVGTVAVAFEHLEPYDAPPNTVA